ncbi:MAG: DegT/DnrJ/EryC1/StrS family aminotransferase [Planctomycetota bacterium]
MLTREDRCSNGRSVAGFRQQDTRNPLGILVLTSDDELAARLWSNHNCRRRPGRAWYEHFILGGNHRLSEFQGAILHAQWDRFDDKPSVYRLTD